MDQKIIDYIKTSLEKGHELEKIKQALITVGHDIQSVDEHATHALKLHNGGKKRDIKISYIPILMGLAIITFIILGIYFFAKIDFSEPQKNATAINPQITYKQDVGLLNKGANRKQ